MVKRFFAGQAEHHIPCDLADLRRNEAVVAPLRARLAHVRHLAELITNPPVILIDEGQKLFFYRGVPVLLRPASFVYMLLLAQTPGEWVLRESIYQRLWPGEMNYEGTNMPYERQITDQKRKLLDDIRKGIAGKVESSEGEMESLIIARHKMGYMLNLDRANVVIIHRMALGATPLLIWFVLDRFFSEWFNWLHLDMTVQTFL
ncbi:MAG: hypothetical protein M0009_13580 [Deltaproteobacteria bacterium]|nr:hypothetical protein [Deltaproteobacteria bacterium]